MKLSHYQPGRTSHQRKSLLSGLILSTALVLFLASSNAAWAADAANRQQAMQIALQQTGGSGKVLGVQETKNQNGQIVYAVKVLSDGRIRIIRINQSR